MENGKYGQELEKNPIHGVELLCKMNEDKYGYNTWWKIGIALLDSFPREVAEKIFVGLTTLFNLFITLLQSGGLWKRYIRNPNCMEYRILLFQLHFDFAFF